MTEYDRTPIFLADMQWGDLLDRDLHPLPEGSQYVGRDPFRNGIIAASKAYGVARYDYDYWDWYKLTPKPEPVLCKHCGGEIHCKVEGTRWWHASSCSVHCPPFLATPATDTKETK